MDEVYGTYAAGAVGAAPAAAGTYDTDDDNDHKNDDDFGCGYPLSGYWGDRYPGIGVTGI